MIAGPSTDVTVTDNEIEGGSRNGITLGNFSVLDSRGTDTGQPTGLVVKVEDRCATTGTLVLPNTPSSGPSGSTIVAGGRLVNITLEGNRIRNMGMCGIGPVGFFDLAKVAEVITIDKLTVTGNEISNTLLRAVAASSETLTTLGYGAICVPDVQSLVVHDNAITDYGDGPGAAVCGIFVLHAEGVDLSRNRIIQTSEARSLLGRSDRSGAAQRILVALVTPPTAGTTASANLDSVSKEFLVKPVYETGLPALRVEHNVVRVPVGLALTALGIGAFTIVNNFFSSGELVERAIASTVEVANLGVALELARPTTKASALYFPSAAEPTALGLAQVGSATDGAVLFTDNICQVRASAQSPTATSSVLIISLDHLLFANNHCRVESPKRCFALDALLLSSTIQVESNRFQEAFNSVVLSGLTTGLMNITSGNISTYCLLAFASMPTRLVAANNLALIGTDVCTRYEKQLSAANVP